MRYYTRGFIKSAGILNLIIGSSLADARVKSRRNKMQREILAYPSMLRWDRLNPLPQYTPQSTDLAVQRQQYLLWLNNVYKPWQQRRVDLLKRINDQQLASLHRLVKIHNESPFTDSSVELPDNMHTHLRKSLGGSWIRWVAPNTYEADHKDLYMAMYKDKKIGLRNWYQMLANRAKLWEKRGGPGEHVTMPHIPPRPRNKLIKWMDKWFSAPSDYLRIYTNRYSDYNALLSPSDMRGLLFPTPSSIVTLPSLIVPQKLFALKKLLPASPAFSPDALRYATPRHLVQGHGLARTVLSQPVGNTMPSSMYNAQGRYDFLDDMPVHDRVDYIGYAVPLTAGAIMRFKPDATNAFGETPATFNLAANNFMTNGYAEYDPKSNMVRMTKKYVDSAKVPDPDMLPLLTAWYRAKHPLAVPKLIPHESWVLLLYKHLFTPRSTEMKLYQPPLGYDPKQWLLDALFYYRMSNNTKKLRDKYVG